MTVENVAHEYLAELMRRSSNTISQQNPTLILHGKNPHCGDTVTLHCHIDAQILTCVEYKHQGCYLSKSTSAMATEAFAGYSLERLLELIEAIQQMCRGEKASSDLPIPFQYLSEYQSFPLRHPCLLLPFRTLSLGLNKFKEKKLN